MRTEQSEALTRGAGRVRLSSPNYLVLKPLGEQLAARAAEVGQLKPMPDVLDIGCGPKPYEALFSRYGGNYWGIDISKRTKADVLAPMERLPVRDCAVDIIVCTQVLQSCRQPLRALIEMRRVLRPSGILLLSTHGTWLRDPGIADYWRWTDEGLRLASEEAGYDVLEVLPNGGIVACLTYLTVSALSGLSYQSRLLAPIRWLLVPVMNLLGETFDGTVNRLSPSSSCLLVGNYLLVARRPSDK
ncbi:MAG: class I SAM-dependent methyltransferase [Nitriliruptorales bacterium]